MHKYKVNISFANEQNIENKNGAFRFRFVQISGLLFKSTRVFHIVRTSYLNWWVQYCNMYCISFAHVFVKLSTRKVFEQHQLSGNLFRVMRSFGYRAKTWRLVSRRYMCFICMVYFNELKLKHIKYTGSF